MGETLTIPDDFLRRVAARVAGAKGEQQERIIAAVEPQFQAVLAQYEINTPQRVAYFAGQICHESDQFCTTEEYASGRAYEGRRDLGNTQPGDGVRFKGRGLIMITGRANYASYGGPLGLDLIAHPELAADPVNSLRIAAEYWHKRNCNAAADDDDLEGVTRLVNGGLMGLDDRAAATDRAFDALGVSQ